MKIAIWGATSEIAKDLITSFAKKSGHELSLFGRNTLRTQDWLEAQTITRSYKVLPYDGFLDSENYDAIINFVGVGNPAKATSMGASIMEVTQTFDTLALTYLKKNPECRYLFLSSGAVYGQNFQEPANEFTSSIFPINNLSAKSWYGLAKLYTEAQHRAHAHLAITDIRVFNYFSHTQNLDNRFLINDALRAIKSGQTLPTPSENIHRDYLGADDFHQLIEAILKAPAINRAIDCYSKAPIDKFTLLELLARSFNLKYSISDHAKPTNAFGFMSHYYSENKVAEQLFGYTPSYSSAELIHLETAKLFNL